MLTVLALSILQRSHLHQLWILLKAFTSLFKDFWAMLLPLQYQNYQDFKSQKQASQLFQRPKKLMQKTQCHLLPLHQTPAQWCTPTRQFQPGLGCEAPESGHANIAWQDPPSIANMANIANMDCIDYRSANRIACWLLINVVNEKYTMQYVA